MLDAPQDPSSSRPPGRAHSKGGGTSQFDALGSAQAIGALVLGILLFAVPLYLWRRPRSVQPSVRLDAALSDASSADGGPLPAPVPDAGRPPPVRLAGARVLECHDRGSRRTAPEECDHIPQFEKAFAEAIEATHECVPPDAGAGSLEFVADLSFARRRSPVTVALPRDARSYQSPKIVKDCMIGVRARLAALPLATFPHAHARYKVALVASYGDSAAR